MAKKCIRGKFNVRIVSHLMEKPRQRDCEIVPAKLEWRFVPEKKSNGQMKRGCYFRYAITAVTSVDWRMRLEGRLIFSQDVFAGMENGDTDAMRLFCRKIRESNPLLQDRMLVPAFVFDWNMEKEIVKAKIAEIMRSDPGFMDEWLEDFWTGGGYYVDAQKLRELERVKNKVIDRMRHGEISDEMQED